MKIAFISVFTLCLAMSVHGETDEARWSNELKIYVRKFLHETKRLQNKPDVRERVKEFYSVHFFIDTLKVRDDLGDLELEADSAEWNRSGLKTTLTIVNDFQKLYDIATDSNHTLEEKLGEIFKETSSESKQKLLKRLQGEQYCSKNPALTAALKKQRWREVRTSCDDTYYWNTKTNQTTWKYPIDADTLTESLKKQGWCEVIAAGKTKYWNKHSATGKLTLKYPIDIEQKMNELVKQLEWIVQSIENDVKENGPSPNTKAILTHFYNEHFKHWSTGIREEFESISELESYPDHTKDWVKDTLKMFYASDSEFWSKLCEFGVEPDAEKRLDLFHDLKVDMAKFKDPTGKRLSVGWTKYAVDKNGEATWRL